MLADLTHDHFEGRAGQTFRATTGEGQILTLELTEVQVGNPAGDGHRTPFSIELVAADHVPQQTFQVEHDELGSFELFLVPLGPSEAGMRYEAVFG